MSDCSLNIQQYFAKISHFFRNLFRTFILISLDFRAFKWLLIWLIKAWKRFEVITNYKRSSELEIKQLECIIVNHITMRIFPDWSCTLCIQLQFIDHKIDHLLYPFSSILLKAFHQHIFPVSLASSLTLLATEKISNDFQVHLRTIIILFH